MTATAEPSSSEALPGPSDRWFRLLSQSMPQIVCVVALDGTVEYVNGAWMEVSGKSLEETAAAGWPNLIHPDDHAAARDCIRATLHTLRPRDVEVRYRARDGSWRWFLCRLAPIVEGGRVVRFIGAGMDIEARKRAEDALRRAAELIDLGDAFCEVDRDFRVVQVNANQERLSRTPRAASIGRTLWEVWPDAARPGSRYGREYRRCMEERVPVQFDDYYEPLDLWTSITAYPIGGGGIAIFSRDISGQKRAEAALRDALERLEIATDAAQLGIFDRDVGKGTTRWDARVRALWGVGRDERVSYETFIAGVHPDDRPGTEAAIARALDPASDGRYRVEYRVRSRDGQERWVAVAGRAVVAEGRVTRLVGTVQDVTAERRLHDALLESERQLRAAHQRLRLHVESTPLAVIEWDSDYRVIGYSRRAQELLGWSAQEVIGKRIDEIPWVPDEDWPAVRAVMRGMTGAARPTNVSANRNRRKDGTVIHCEWYNSSLYDDAGRLLSVLSFVLDVTERRKAEEALRRSEQRLRVALDAASFGTFDYDPGTGAAARDAQLRRIWGLAPDEELDYRASLARIHPDDRERVRQTFAAALAPTSDGRYRSEYRIVWPDGTVHWCNASGRVYFAGEGVERRAVRVVGVEGDVSERKQAEAALHEANERLREADRRKDEFLGMLSHELRNPLAPIRNASYLLRQAPPGSDQATRAQLVIERQTEHLTRLVDDLLDVTRIARGKIELRRSQVDLREIVVRAAEDFRLPMDDRGIAFRTALPDAPVWALVDATRVTQVVGNLLHNAAKFTRRGDEVTLSLAVAGDDAVVTVRDSGAGIDAALLPSIFDPFVQGERTLARTEGGLGLGLALVKGITELHGGTATVSSRGRGMGSEFEVRLPLSAAAPRLGAPSPRAERRGTGHRVLVVDDNRDAADTLAELVRVLGHEAEVAYDGQAALDAVRERSPDVVLCDLGLPGMSGYDVAKAVRAAGNDAVRLLAVSGYAQPEDVRRAVEAGFDAHVAKPPDPERLDQLLAGA